MSNHHGTEGALYSGSNAVGELVEYTYRESAEFDEDTELADTWKTTHSAARQEWSGEAVCHFDETDTNGQETLTIGASLTIHFYPEGVSTGNIDDTGTIRVTGVEVSVARPQVTSRRFTFEGSGALTHTTQ